MATPSVRLDTVPLGNDQHSWVLTSEGKTLHNGEVIAMLEDKPVEGDMMVRKWWGEKEVLYPARASPKIFTLTTFSLNRKGRV